MVLSGVALRNMLVRPYKYAFAWLKRYAKFAQRYRDLAHFIKLVLYMQNLLLLLNLLSLSYGGSRTGIFFFIEQVERAKTITKEVQPIKS